LKSIQQLHFRRYNNLFFKPSASCVAKSCKYIEHKAKKKAMMNSIDQPPQPRSNDDELLIVGETILYLVESCIEFGTQVIEGCTVSLSGGNAIVLNDVSDLVCLLEKFVLTIINFADNHYDGWKPFFEDNETFFFCFLTIISEAIVILELGVEHVAYLLRLVSVCREHGQSLAASLSIAFAVFSGMIAWAESTSFQSWNSIISLQSEKQIAENFKVIMAVIDSIINESLCDSAIALAMAIPLSVFTDRLCVSIDYIVDSSSAMISMSLLQLLLSIVRQISSSTSLPNVLPAICEFLHTNITISRLLNWSRTSECLELCLSIFAALWKSKIFIVERDQLQSALHEEFVEDGEILSDVDEDTVLLNTTDDERDSSTIKRRKKLNIVRPKMRSTFCLSPSIHSSYPGNNLLLVVGCGFS
jgi:hypothetical protein